MSDVHIILFYKFVDIKDPEGFAKSQREFCAAHELLGKILVAGEGINGSLSGPEERISSYKNYLAAQEGFEDITFKEELATFHPFKKLIVRIKKEIIRFERALDMNKRGTYITADELLELYESGEDLIIVDKRMNYE